jgi:glycosyltransferase involved in cell wall biosynthesis
MIKLLMPSRELPAGHRPRVSIVVPCYNYGNFLQECVDSVLAQPSVDVDVLIIDDASPDGSGAVAEDIASRDSRVSVIRHAHNRGHIATYNEGLEQATGDYAIMLSADDMIPPGALARSVALMEAHPSVGFSYGYPLNFTGSAPPAITRRAFGWSVWPGASWIRAQSRRGLNCIYSTEVVMRTSVMKSVGLYRSNLPHTADLELWLRIAAVADVGHVNGPVQAYRRVHSASMLQTSYSDLLIDLIERKKAFDAFFTQDGAAVSGSRESYRIILRRLAAEALEQASRLRKSGKGAEVTEGYAKFALETYSRTATLPAWREYQLLGSQDIGRLDSIRGHGYAARRNFGDRFRWRRWNAMGV